MLVGLHQHYILLLVGLTSINESQLQVQPPFGLHIQTDEVVESEDAWNSKLVWLRKGILINLVKTRDFDEHQDTNRDLKSNVNLSLRKFGCCLLHYLEIQEV